MRGCRACGSSVLHRVLDLGTVPAADHFPAATAPVDPAEASHRLVMELCDVCGLAQLADDDTQAEEPRGVEPVALRDQARAAVGAVGDAGWLRGATVREFGSPHGGSWLALMADRGFGVTSAAPADVVLDSFGAMHEPDQRAAFAERAAATAPDGVLMLQYHSLGTIVRDGQWNALRHGHFAYYSLPALERLLAGAGMRAVAAWEYPLYGGTVLIAAVHADDPRELPSAPGRARLETVRRREADLVHPEQVGALQAAADGHVRALRDRLAAERAASHRIYAYGAASRAVALFSLARLDAGLVAGVADASPEKQQRRMPGTDIPIISPDALSSAEVSGVLLTVPDLLEEVAAELPALEGKWLVDDPVEGLREAVR